MSILVSYGMTAYDNTNVQFHSHFELSSSGSVLNEESFETEASLKHEKNLTLNAIFQPLTHNDWPGF